MVQVRKCILIAAAVIACTASSDSKGPRFYPDDPVWEMPQPLPVKNAHKRKIDQLYDFVLNSIAPPGDKQLPGQIIPAEGVNTLGEVPDSTWYTNRHYWHPMSIEALRRGPASGNEPVPPFRVTGAKNEGITPGFQIQDSAGHTFICKPDPMSNPEMATAADVVSSKFFYAFGYNVPENYIFYFSRDQLSIDPEAKINGLNGKERLLNEEDLRRILDVIPRDNQRRYRMMASLFIPGKGIGPFRWYGVRRDDPDDIYRHENRRSLRGLYVFCAWLNHTDVKANNTYDTIADVRGVPAIVHYLIDFGASLGSDSDEPKNARLGHEYMIEKDKAVLLKMASLGLYSPRWERADYPGIPAVGRFEAATFEPDKWRSNYPNSAFLNRLPDDTFWAAKQVMAFSREEILAMVETGRYSNLEALDYIAGTLLQRQHKIGRTFFAQVLPLDRFTVSGGVLRFDDLDVKYKFVPARTHSIEWFRFNNDTGVRTAIPSATGPRVPRDANSGYVVAQVAAADRPGKLVRVYVCGDRVIGVDRTW